MHSGGSTHSTNSDGGGDDGNGGGDCRQLTLCLTSNNSLPSQTERKESLHPQDQYDNLTQAMTMVTSVQAVG